MVGDLLKPLTEGRSIQAGLLLLTERAISIHRVAAKRSSRKLKKHEGIRTRNRMPLYLSSIRGFGSKINPQVLAGRFRPRQAMISRLSSTTNATKKIIAGKA